MSDKVNNAIGKGIAGLVGVGILYGIYTWAANGNPIFNIITGSLLLISAVIVSLRFSKEQWPFGNLKNDWQTLAVWLGIAVVVIVGLLFVSGFGKYFS